MRANRPLAAPPVWSDEQLEAGRRTAIATFVAERQASGNAPYLAAHAANVPAVDDLFDATNDLLAFGDGAALSVSPERLRVARYLAAPIVSADDLDTLTSTRVTKVRRVSADMAVRAAGAIQAVIDPIRFTWLYDDPQAAGVAIFWEHDLAALADFVGEASG